MKFNIKRRAGYKLVICSVLKDATVTVVSPLGWSLSWPFVISKKKVSNFFGERGIEERRFIKFNGLNL